MTFKVGDWVIHDYEIKQIQEMEDGRVTQVSCGSFQCSGRDLQVRPLTLRNKRYAESFEYYDNELRKLPGSNALNWPDIHRHFCELCFLAIDTAKEKYAEGEMNHYLKEGEKFVMSVKEKLRGVSEVNGVRLFR